MVKTIGNPFSWSSKTLARSTRWADMAAGHIGSHGRRAPRVRALAGRDIRRALRLGFEDFLAMRSDVPFAVAIYAAVALLLAGIASGTAPLHLAFPLVAGCALIGPIAGIGLFEMSKRREAGQPAGLGTALGAIRADTLGPILALAGYLLVIFAFWLYLADRIHAATLGPEALANFDAFLAATLTTPEGWAMIGWGVIVGFLLACLVLVTSLVSFPMLVDRPVGLPVAVVTSFRVATRNPAAVAAWGLVIAVMLLVGALPAFLGLIVVIPVLGHASWHLYRAAVRWD